MATATRFCRLLRSRRWSRYEQPRPRRGVLKIIAKTLFALVALRVMVRHRRRRGHLALRRGHASPSSAAAHEGDREDAQDARAPGARASPRSRSCSATTSAFKGSGAGDPSRSDTIMLVRMDPEKKTMTLLSFPRDLAGADLLPRPPVPARPHQLGVGARRAEVHRGHGQAADRAQRSTTWSPSTSRASSRSSTRSAACGWTSTGATTTSTTAATTTTRRSTSSPATRSSTARRRCRSSATATPTPISSQRAPAALRARDQGPDHARLPRDDDPEGGRRAAQEHRRRPRAARTST